MNQEYFDFSKFVDDLDAKAVKKKEASLRHIELEKNNKILYNPANSPNNVGQQFSVNTWIHDVVDPKLMQRVCSASWTDKHERDVWQ